MLGLFIHDHKFPKVEGNYHYSYGFDSEFFNRYLAIFGNLSVIAREKNLDIESVTTNSVDKNVQFTTIRNLKELKKKKTRDNIKQAIKKCDYMVIRLPSILGLYSVKFAKKYNKPYIIEVVGCAWDAIANKGFTQIPFAFFIMNLMKKAILNAKYVVYVTEEFLQKRYPTRGKSISCSNVTLESVEKIDLDKRLTKISQLEGTNERITIGTCATLDVIYKGQEDVIQAIATLKKDGYNIEYQLVGGGNASYLKDIARKFGVLENIKIIGALEHHDVFTWLEDIDIYVQPSKQEGLSRAIIEAMSKGCPIFGADAGGIHEQIDNHFIFDKGDIEGICRIYNKFTKVTMSEQAIKNHKNSQRYIKENLYGKRRQFFEDFIKQNQMSRKKGN